MGRVSRQVAMVPVAVCLLFGAVSTFHAQSAQSPHTLTFSQTAYAVNAVTRDPSGNVWFAGGTCSTTLATTSDAIQPAAPDGGCHGLFGRMRPDGAVTYLSYLGGAGGQTTVKAIATDASGAVFLAGWTYSPQFPTTAGAYDRACGSDGTCITTKFFAGRMQPIAERDGFVVKLTPAADRLVFSTYIGGADADHVEAMAIDGSGRVHVTGGTMSTDFPTTAGALQSSYAFGTDPDSNALDDAFYARLSADGSALDYGTYLGGFASDDGSAIAIDGGGDAYVAGQTGSPDFPTMNAAQPRSTDRVTSPPTGHDGFLARFSGTGAVYSTYVGGSSGDSITGVSVVDGAVFLAGNTTSADFPGGGATNEGAVFIAEAAAATGAVNRTTLIHGAGGSDFAGSLVVDASHVAYLAGTFANVPAGTTAFPVTADAYQKASGGGADAFFSIVDLSTQPASVRYSTLFGASGDQFGGSVATDGAGGAFYVASSGFPGNNASTSSVAHVSTAQPSGSSSDIVLYTHDATSIGGNWQLVADSTAADGARMWNPDAGVPKIATAAASPANYFDVTFNAQAGVPYHLWLRMKADNDSYQNDSVFVQFSDSVDGSGNPIWRISSTSATVVSLEDCGGCGEQGWGWNDNGYGTAGTPVIFATSGTHTLRVQQREDGVSIDQIVLSSATYLNNAPGANKNDTTIVPQGGTPPPPPPPSNQPPTVTLTSPTDGETLTAPATLTVSGTATDSDGSVARVDIYINGEIKSSGGTTNGQFSATWFQQPAGTYTFTVVATDNQGASTTSAPRTVRVTINTSGDLHGLKDADVGATGATGSASYANGTFTVNGAGADVWGTADAFNYAYLPITGDATIVARVATVSSEANWVKAGVMIRATTWESSAQAFMLVSHARGVAFQRRTTPAATSVSTSGTASTAPHWVSLTRTGATISAYESDDGSNWTLVGSDTFESPGMPDTVLFGLAVSSHVPGTLATATFDNVSITLAGAPPSPPPPPSGDQCSSVTLSQTSFYSGGPASKWNVTVTAPSATCTWTASIDQSWLLLNGASGPTTISGTGSGTVTLQTTDNRTGANRFGVITIGGTPYKVTQEPF